MHNGSHNEVAVQIRFDQSILSTSEGNGGNKTIIPIYGGQAGIAVPVVDNEQAARFQVSLAIP